MYEQLTQIEKLCEKQVEREFGLGLWAEYLVAREKVFKDLLPHIARNEPFLTDHSPEHITNVFRNAYDLLGKDCCVGKDSMSSLETAELYFLVLAILFHDVGNVFSRKGHKAKLGEAYEFSRGIGQLLLPERQLLFRIVEAHGGETRQGSSDTIGPLEPGVFKGKRVDCRRVAAILRFADELAEGPQRTSLFMQTYLPYPKDSQVFHDYAAIAHHHIDREQGRVTIVYHLEMFPDAWGSTYDPERMRLLLKHCYHRIQKLDLERKYNRHYCSLLAPFRNTEASFHFHHKGEDLRLDLTKIVLDDLILPNQFDAETIPNTFPAYQLDALMQKLEAIVRPVPDPAI